MSSLSKIRFILVVALLLILCYFLTRFNEASAENVTLTVSFNRDPPWYARGMTVYVSGTVYRDGQPYAYAIVGWEVYYNGIRYTFGESTCDSNGRFTFNFKTKINWPTGKGKVIVTVNGTSVKVIKYFYIKEFSIKFNFSKPEPATYVRGEYATINGSTWADGQLDTNNEYIKWEVYKDSTVVKSGHLYSSNGYFTFSFKVEDTWSLGKYKLKVWGPYINASMEKIFYVKGYTTVSLRVIPNMIGLGKKVKLKGDISPNPGVVTVYFYYRLSGSNTWTLIGQNDTDASGRFELEWTPPAVAVYELKANWTGNEYFLANESSIVSLRVDRVKVVEYMTSDDRCDVESTQYIKAKLIYELDGSIVGDGCAYVVFNNTLVAHFNATTQTWDITYSSPTVGKYCFAITYINETCRNIGDSFIIEAASMPCIIWDRIVIIKYYIPNCTRSVDYANLGYIARVDINTTQVIIINATYEYDNSLVEDYLVVLNGTFTGSLFNTTFKGVAVYVNYSGPDAKQLNYIVTAVNEHKYGLSKFYDNATNKASIIWDFIKITEGGVSDDRADVGSTQTVWFKAKYAFDGQTYSEGELYINNVNSTFSSGRWEITTSETRVGKYYYRVTAVKDKKHGLTKYVCKIIESIIFDRVKVILYSKKERYNVGENATVWIKAFYEYDKEEFDVKNIVLNDYDFSKDDVGEYSYTVVSINDPKYQLTKKVCEGRIKDRIIREKLPIIFDRLKIDNVTVDNINEVIEIFVVFESDNKPISSGSIRIEGLVNGSITLIVHNGYVTFSYSEDMFKGVDKIYITPVLEYEYQINKYKEKYILEVHKLIFAIDFISVNQLNVTANFTCKYDTGVDATNVEYTLEIDSAIFHGIKSFKGSDCYRMALHPGINYIKLIDIKVHDTDFIVVDKYKELNRVWTLIVSLTLREEIYENYYPEFRCLAGDLYLNNKGNVTISGITIHFSLLERPEFKVVRNLTVTVKAGKTTIIRARALDVCFPETIPTGSYTLVMRVSYIFRGIEYTLTEIQKAINIRSVIPKHILEADEFFRALEDYWSERKYHIVLGGARKLRDEAFNLYAKGKVNESIAKMNEAIEFAKKSNRTLWLLAYYKGEIKKLNNTYKDIASYICIEKLNATLIEAWSKYDGSLFDEALNIITRIDNGVKGFKEDIVVSFLRNALGNYTDLQLHVEHILTNFCNVVEYFIQGKYDDALKIVSDKMNMLNKMYMAYKKKEEAKDEIARARREGRFWGLDKADRELDEAEKAFNNFNYDEAYRHAEKAIEYARSAISPTLIITVIIIVVVVIAIIVFTIIRRRKIKKEIEKIREELKEQ